MTERSKQLTLSLDLETILEDIDPEGAFDIEIAVEEYMEYLKEEEIPFTQEGSVFTFKGTESELVEVMYKDQLYWGAGFSFSEKDALEEIREQNA